jgi:hypothetical protein
MYLDASIPCVGQGAGDDQGRSAIS